MSTLRPGTKIHRIAVALHAGQRMTMFDAERMGDHVLRTTVATLERRGARISRKTVICPTRWGSDTHVCEYWVEPEDRPAIARLLGLPTPQNQPQSDAARAYLLASRGGA